MAELVDTYTDGGLDAADASIAAIAERLNKTVIATLDEPRFPHHRPHPHRGHWNCCLVSPERLI